MGGTPQYTVLSYDDLGRVIEALQPDGGTATTTYHGLTTTGLLHVIRPDATTQDQTTSTLKNDLGSPATVTDALSGVTHYTYNAVGELLTVVDPASHTVANNGYDLVTALRKLTSVDADMGTWSYATDSFGELVSQTDAKGQTVSMVYDALGRMTSRSEPDMASVWTYGTSLTQHNVGKLASASCSGTACQSGGYTRTPLYDTLGRPDRLTITLGTASYYTTTAYDSISGKKTSVRAFSGFSVVYAYNLTGYLFQIDDAVNMSLVYWQADTRDAELHLLTQTAGNGLVTTQGFDPESGRVLAIAAGTSASVANLSYAWDTAGNLFNRGDMLAVSGGETESFCYDALNRLTNSNLSNGAHCDGTGTTAVTYDSTGNILTKTGIGTYSYGSGAGPHALTSIATCSGCTVNGVANPSYTYDANGDMTAGAGRSVTYTSFNMAASISEGSGSISVALTYDSEHQRIQQAATQSGTIVTTSYLNDPSANVMTEALHQTGQNSWKTYIVADGKIVAQRVTVNGNPAVTMNYFVLDHLGSVAVITDATGAVITGGRQFYDSWGKMRNADGSADSTCSKPAASVSTRGYTNQEEMPSVCLVNYNARIYDPAVGRFLSADSTTESPYDPQDWNRYAYVGNNPLSFTDPSGNCFLGCGSSLLKAIVGIALAVVLNFVVLPELELAFSVGQGLAAATGFLVPNAFISAGVAGYVTTGSMQGALMAGMQAVVTLGFGAQLDFTNAPISETFLVHGMIGGLFSIGQKGGFRSGFLAAGIASLGDAIEEPGNDPGALAFNSAEHAALGGAGSVLGGGKFANGAVTGAFGYLFNRATKQVALDELQVQNNAAISQLETNYHYSPQQIAQFLDEATASVDRPHEFGDLLFAVGRSMALKAEQAEEGTGDGGQAAATVDDALEASQHSYDEQFEVAREAAIEKAFGNLLNQELKGLDQQFHGNNIPIGPGVTYDPGPLDNVPH